MAGGCKHPPLRRDVCRSTVFARRSTCRANLAACHFCFFRLFAGGCRAGVHARRGSLWRRGVFGGRDRPPYKSPAGGRGRQAVSRRTGPAAGGCKHPPLRGGVCRSAVFACRGTRRANLAAGRFRFCRLFAEGCRAGVHARRGRLRRRGVFGGRDRPPYKSPAGGRRRASGISLHRPNGGRMQASAPTQGWCVARYSFYLKRNSLRGLCAGRPFSVLPSVCRKM